MACVCASWSRAVDAALIDRRRSHRGGGMPEAPDPSPTPERAPLRLRRANRRRGRSGGGAGTPGAACAHATGRMADIDATGAGCTGRHARCLAPELVRAYLSCGGCCTWNGSWSILSWRTGAAKPFPLRPSSLTDITQSPLPAALARCSCPGRCSPTTMDSRISCPLLPIVHSLSPSGYQVLPRQQPSTGILSSVPASLSWRQPTPDPPVLNPPLERRTVASSVGRRHVATTSSQSRGGRR